MKRGIILMVLLLSMFSFSTVKAQTFAVGGETGFSIFSPNGANFALPIGANLEWDINGNLSLQTRVSFDIGLGRADFNYFYINPEIRYHFSETFSGAYVGGYFGFGPASFNSFYMSLGAVGGYEIMVSDNFNIDISGQLGFGHLGNSFVGFNGLHFRPTVGLRYVL